MLSVKLSASLARGAAWLAVSTVCALAPITPAAAQQAAAPGEEHMEKGDYFFKAGYYLKASEHFRLALLEDPGSPTKKLAFGHALFAIGNYSYASYALRRGVAQLDPSLPFRPDIESLFPSNRAFVQALRDLKRYVTYSPRDPAGLTVLGYVLFSVEGEERRCRDMFRYLQRLDRDDPFAAYFLRQLDRRGVDPAPAVEDEPEPEPAFPLPPVPEPEPLPEPSPEPSPPPVDLSELPEPERQAEQAEGEWPTPTPALAD